MFRYILNYILTIHIGDIRRDIHSMCNLWTYELVEKEEEEQTTFHVIFVSFLFFFFEFSLFFANVRDEPPLFYYYFNIFVYFSFTYFLFAFLFLLFYLTSLVFYFSFVTVLFYLQFVVDVAYTSSTMSTTHWQESLFPLFVIFTTCFLLKQLQTQTEFFRKLILSSSKIP